MSYRVLTSSSIPYVHSLSGLGAELVASTPSDPWGVRLAEALGTPFAQALSQRIAYGTQPYGAYPSSFQFYTPSGQYGGGAFGSFQPSTFLLLGGAALLALMMLRK